MAASDGCPLNAVGPQRGNWVAIPEEAQTDVLLRVVTVDSSGTAAPLFETTFWKNLTGAKYIRIGAYVKTAGTVLTDPVIKNVWIETATLADTTPAPSNPESPEGLPDTMPDLWAWYSWHSGLTVESDRVSQWADLSGNGRHLTQATEALRPGVEAIDDNVAVTFDSDVLSVSEGPDTTAITVCAIMQLSGTELGDHEGLLNCRNGGGYRAAFIAKRNTTGDPITFWDSSGGSFADASIGLTRDIMTVVTWVLEDLGTTGTINIYADGVNIRSSGYSSGAACTVMDVGRSGGSDEWLRGAIGELVICAGKLSDTNREALEAYMRAHWDGTL